MKAMIKDNTIYLKAEIKKKLNKIRNIKIELKIL